MTQSTLNVRAADPPGTASATKRGAAYTRSKWRLPRGKGARAWIASLAFHLGLMVLLGSVTYVATQEFKAAEIESTFDQPEPRREFETVIQADAIGNDSDMQSQANSAAMAAMAGENPKTNLDEQLKELDEADFTLPDVIESPAMADLIERVEVSGEFSDIVGGVEGALDRLVAEIRQSLQERKTLVVWLFDASGSLKERRTAIADRFENIYSQLGQLQEQDDPPLKTVVASFGERHTFITDKPVDDIGKMTDAVRDIVMDESGTENVYATVRDAAQKYYKYRTRAGYNVMIVVVTDERGDDEALLDSVIKFNRRYGIRTYTIGNASTFGRELGYVTWTYPDNSTKQFPVHQGPETAMAERLRLSFWGGSNRDMVLSSGHGPYGLTRLSAETGGLFLITDDVVGGAKFDKAVMRNYRPDYVSRAEYERRVSQNKAKMALVQAAALTKNERDGAINVPRTEFRADSDNILRQQMTESQKPMAKLTYQLDQILSILETGEADREKITEPRWQAGYDLAIGRALAMKVRSLGYNSVLAEMKGQPRKFSDPKNDQWALIPSDQIISGARVKKLAGRARTYLTRIIDEHPNTPWSLLAERELSQPLGWQWVERSVGYAKMDERMRQAGENKPPRDDAALKKREQLQRDGPKGL